jgi:hypothetical protein
MFVEELKGKKLRVRTRCRWEDNIRMYSGKFWTAFIWPRIGTSGGLL